ncbi:MAG: ThiF family adenylyltransferase [Flavobacteriaceae bacterium]
METPYRNPTLSLTKKEQQLISKCPLILFGADVGSAMAECALRLGFEHMTILDDGHVTASDLDSQNYCLSDIGTSKAMALKNRLLSINNNAHITEHDFIPKPKEALTYIKGHKIAINTFNDASHTPSAFNTLCKEQGIPVVHPYNLGWGGLITIVMPYGPSLDFLGKGNTESYLATMLTYVSGYLKFWGNSPYQVQEMLERYTLGKGSLGSPPLSIASWMVAAKCTHLLFNIATGKPVKKFPDFYLTTSMDL